MWSNQRKNKVYDNSNYVINIRCRTTNAMLGSMPNNPDLFREFIVSKNPNADERELEQALAMEPFNTDEQMEKQMTVFPKGKFFRTTDGVWYDPVYDVVPDDAEGEMVFAPFIWDYQWKGAFKEAISMLTKASGGKTKKAAAKDESEGTEEEGGTKKKKATKKLTAPSYASSKITAFKKMVDGNWFVKQRRIPLEVPETYINDLGVTENTYDGNGNLKTLTRPLRADTAQGPRVALATSEMVPAGTEFYLTIRLLNPEHKEALIECLDFKEGVGMCQWRGGGKGTLIWTPADENGKPIDDIP
jgi:hypothetical protein